MERLWYPDKAEEFSLRNREGIGSKTRCLGVGWVGEIGVEGWFIAQRVMAVEKL